MPENLRPEDLPKHFDDVVKRLKTLSFKPVLEKCRAYILHDIGLNFYKSSSPSGGAWPPRKVEGDGHPLLILTRALLTAATGGAGSIYELTDDSLTVGVDGSAIPYAAVHNFGGKKMPQRKYMDVMPETVNFCQELIADYALEKIWG